MREKIEKDILLVEYQKAQDSAEHHDNLVWTISSIILSGMLVLIGFSLNFLSDPTFKSLILPIVILGILLTIFLWILQSDFRSIRIQKYERCKKIEEKLGMEQHTKLKYATGIQTKMYKGILIMLILIWILVLLKSFGVF